MQKIQSVMEEVNSVEDETLDNLEAMMKDSQF